MTTPAPAPEPPRPAPPWRVLAALAAGIALGAVLGPRPALIATAEVIGGVWLDALRMTIVPLIVALLVASVGGANAAGGLTLRALKYFVILLGASALIGALGSAAWFAFWSPAPLAMPATETAMPAGALSSADWFRALIPPNIVKAAADGAIVPLVLFALLLGFAVARLPAEPKRRILALFEALAAAMLVIVRWVLWLAPLGVFALAALLAARTGFAVAGALASYVLLVILLSLVLIALAYPLARFAGGVPFAGFARAAAPAQAVAFSTQSSLASLPVMLAAAERMNLPRSAASVVLPFVVALFRVSGPIGIVAASFTMAALAGEPMGLDRIVIVAALAALCSLVIVGVPGQASFFAANAPPALAAGLPIEALPLLLAIDVIPDMFRTTANITMDVAVTAVATRGESDAGETKGL